LPVSENRDDKCLVIRQIGKSERDKITGFHNSGPTPMQALSNRSKPNPKYYFSTHGRPCPQACVGVLGNHRIFGLTGGPVKWDRSSASHSS
jgi:hypothetical protein